MRPICRRTGIAERCFQVIGGNPLLLYCPGRAQTDYPGQPLWELKTTDSPPAPRPRQLRWAHVSVRC
jgi:hypothetical protein